MTAVPDRYCARGEQCVHYRNLAEPAKLSVYNKNAECESCRRKKDDDAGEAEGTKPPKAPLWPRTEEEYRAARLRREDRAILKSSERRRLLELKRELVLQLFTRSGPFWEEIERLRSRWDVTPVKQLPPQLSVADRLLPEGAPEYPEDEDPFSENQSAQAEEHEEYAVEWNGDLISAIQRVLPPKYVNFRWMFVVWMDFFAACLLYDPPDTDLLAFAKYRDPRLLDPREIDWFDDPDGDKHPMLLHLTSPLIREILYDPEELAGVVQGCFLQLIHEMGERHLKPLGIDIHTLLKDTIKNTPHIDERYQEGIRDARFTNNLLIEVDEHTTEDDVRTAFRAISATQKRRPKTGRPGRDRLKCVECAVLHDRHGWDYNRLAERYGWKDPTLASNYVKDGREILEG